MKCEICSDEIDAETAEDALRHVHQEHSLNELKSNALEGLEFEDGEPVLVAHAE